MDKDNTHTEQAKARYPRYDSADTSAKTYNPIKVAEAENKPKTTAPTTTPQPPTKNEKGLKHEQTLITSEGEHKKKKFKPPEKLVKVIIAVIIVLILFFGVTAVVSRN